MSAPNPVLEWVSATDRLPKKRGFYLAWLPESRCVGVSVAAHYSVVRWNGEKFVNPITVSHWTKLPEPPK